MTKTAKERPIHVSDHAVGRFRVRFPHMIPEGGASDGDIKAFLAALAARAMLQGSHMTTGNGREACANGVRFILDRWSNGRLFVATVLNKRQKKFARSTEHRNSGKKPQVAPEESEW